jgi:hypothetical protein
MENVQSQTLRKWPGMFARASLPARALDALLLVLALGALKRTFQDSFAYSEDFQVYWKAANAWLDGRNPYAYTVEDRGFVFKYPPWLLPLFLPIGLLSYASAKVAWYALSVGCIAYAIRWCVRQGVPARIAALTACLFWWMFHAHLAAGQFTLLILTAALWAAPKGVRLHLVEERVNSTESLRPNAAALPNVAGHLREALLAYILSAKVFSLYTLTGAWRRFLKPAPWIAGIALFVATHALVLAVNWKTGASLSLIEIYRDFAAAASSGGAELGAIIVRGQGNHGLTALMLRTLGVDSLSFASDMLGSLAIFIPLGALWARRSGGLTEAERWAGWIALALITHPLAWHHSFVLAYPLCTLSIARAARVPREAGRARILALAILGACCIGIFIPQVLGKTLVKPIELAGCKSWGVVLSAVALVWAASVGAGARSLKPTDTSAKEHA